MKLSSVTILAAAALLFTGCDTFDHLFHGSHHDAAASVAAPSGSNDTRYWDPQRNQWVAGPAQGSPASANAKPGALEASRDPEPPAAPAPTPRPARATGVYNSSTGKIDWQSGGYTTAAAPMPAPERHWWWPF